MLCLASAHVLVHLDYGTFVGDAIEKTALEALDWALIFSGKVTPTHPQAAAALKPTIRRQFFLFYTKMHADRLCTDKFG